MTVGASPRSEFQAEVILPATVATAGLWETVENALVTAYDSIYEILL